MGIIGSKLYGYSIYQHIDITYTKGYPQCPGSKISSAVQPGLACNILATADDPWTHLRCAIFSLLDGAGVPARAPRRIKHLFI
jgi:hypothetical protein